MNRQAHEGFELIHDIVKRRWIPEIVESIASGIHSYSDIHSQIDFLSKTELNRKLAFLVEKKVLEKRLVNNRSDYRLSDFGEDIAHIFDHFVDIGQKYVNQ